MKRKLLILAIGSLCLGLVGCGFEKCNSESVSSSCVSDSEVVTEVEGDVISTLIPDVKTLFSDKNINIMRDSSSSYYASIEKATADDFKKYDTELKNYDFTVMDIYGIDDTQGFARYYDKDHKYELDFGYDAKDGGLMTITCDIIAD